MSAAATAIVPVKRFAAAHSRLRDSLSAEQRARLAAAAAADSLEAIARSSAYRSLIVVSGEPAIEPIADRVGAALVEDAVDGGHSEAAEIGIAAALRSGADAVALLPADCPLIDPRETVAALPTGAGGPQVVVIPDRHGTGTNGLLMRPPDAIRPAFGPGSRRRHLTAAASASVPAAVAELPSLALDLDTPDDLRRMSELLGARPDAAPRTAAALRAIAGESEAT